MNEDIEQIRGPDWKNHEYCLIKPYKTAGDIRFINNHSMKVDATTGQSQVCVGDIQWATVARMVRGWNITLTRKQPDGTTQEVPLVFDAKRVEACVDELPGPYFEFIFAEITKRNPPLTEGAQQSFLGSATNGSQGEQNVSLLQLLNEK